jgi:hypothetical protein
MNHLILMSPAESSVVKRVFWGAIAKWASLALPESFVAVVTSDLFQDT